MAGGAEVCSYRQDSMPWAYWGAAVLFGGMGLVLLAGLLVGVIRGTDVNLPGACFGVAAVYLVVWVYGRHRAYELVLIGEEIECRAPLRRRRIPVAAVLSAEVCGFGSPFGERQASLVTATGDEIIVVIPNARHERRFLAFCETVGRRAPTFDGSVTGSRAPG